VLAAPDGELVLLHVAAPEPDFIGYEVGPPSVRDAVAGTLRQAHRRVQELAAQSASAGLRVTPLTVQGMTGDRILDHARRLQADMIAIASHGHGAVHELLAGSLLHELLRGAAVPVVVVPVHPTSD
jgi:nucleotide-binding universal stress UspA family protein